MSTNFKEHYVDPVPVSSKILVTSPKIRPKFGAVYEHYHAYDTSYKVISGFGSLEGDGAQPSVPPLEISPFMNASF